MLRICSGKKRQQKVNFDKWIHIFIYKCVAAGRGMVCSCERMTTLFFLFCSIRNISETTEWILMELSGSDHWVDPYN